MIKAIGKWFFAGAVLSAIAVATHSTHASPGQSACETNTISSGTVGKLGNDVPTCGNAGQYYSSSNGSYGSTGCTNAWILETPNPSGYNSTFNVSPASGYYPRTQTLCQNTVVWLATFDGEGDGVIQSTGPTTCSWAGGLIGCNCTVSYSVPTGTHSRGVGQAKQNGSYIPVEISEIPGPC